MSKYTIIDSSTLITGLTATENYLVTKINDKHVGIPLYTFVSAVPNLDFVTFLPADLVLTNATIYSVATAYNAAIALNVNTSGYSIPIYKIEQSTAAIPQLIFQTPTIVANLAYTNYFLVLKVNGDIYGTPLANYNSTYPFLTTTPASAINITTAIEEGGPVIPEYAMIETGSTNLNSKIRTYKSLINRVLYQLGAPFVNLEVCEDSQMVDFVDKSLEWYTKYAGYTEEFLVFRSDLYKEPGLRIDKLFSITPVMRQSNSYGITGGIDYDLGDYRKVIGIFSFEQGETTGINTLFTLEQAMAQQTYFSYMLGNVGFDLITWEVLKGWLDLREKVLAQRSYIDFDNRNQLLRIIPAPNEGSQYYGAVGAWVERPIKDLIMERWIENYCLALTQISIGHVRGKYSNVQLFGGGSINFNDLLSQGLENKKNLENELMNGYGEVVPARFFIG